MHHYELENQNIFWGAPFPDSSPIAEETPPPQTPLHSLGAIVTSTPHAFLARSPHFLFYNSITADSDGQLANNKVK